MQHFADIKSRFGFTLVELIVVISIIVILLSILLVGVKSVKESAYATQTTNRMRTLGAAFALHVNDKQGKLPSSDHPGTGGSRWPLQIVDYIDLKHIQRSQIYANEIFRDAYQDPEQHTGAAGVFGYNIFFSNTGDDYRWRRHNAIEFPAKTPLLTTTEPKSGGGLLMHPGGPHPNASKMGYKGATTVYGPAPVNGGNGKIFYLMADYSVWVPDRPWPWSDTLGTDFHPKHNLSIKPPH